MAQRALVKTLSLAPLDNSSDKWVVTAQVSLHDFAGQTSALIQSQTFVGFPILGATFRGSLNTQIVQDAAAAGYTVAATDIIYPDSTLSAAIL